MNDRRTHPRIAFGLPVMAVPVLPDGSPDGEHRVSGVALDLSRGGMQVKLPAKANGFREGMSFAIGVEQPGGRVAYEGLIVRHLREGSSGELALGGRFDGPAHRLLRRETRLPRLDRDSLRYEVNLPAGWEKLGIVKPVLLDQVEVCPHCGALPTFRGGCRSCGSGRVVREKLMHHFACAHVDAVEHFEATPGSGDWVCPKCRTRKLVVGSDYEYLETFRCLDCSWSDSDPLRIGHCLGCGHRFPATESAVKTLVGFDADRFDPLAFLAAP